LAADLALRERLGAAGYRYAQAQDSLGSVKLLTASLASSWVMKSLADADVYTLKKMVAQFADGIARRLGR
jgi:hypothetical protein